MYSSTTGQRVIVVRVADGGKSLLDLSIIRWAFEIKNTDGADGLYLSGGHLACLFQRLTLRIAGAQCEDILFYNRLCSMLNQFHSVNSQHSAHIGTGWVWHVSGGLEHGPPDPRPHRGEW